MKITKPIKERLNAHRDMVEKLSTLRDELAFAYSQYGSIKSQNMNGMPRSGSYNGTSETEVVVFHTIELEGKVKRQEEKVNADWAELEPLIEKLKPVETLIMNLRYKYGAEWDDVCRGVYGKRRDYDVELDRYMNRVFKAHGRALLSLSEMVQ